MSKVLLGLMLGAVLGLIDRASAYLYPYPEVQQQIVTIMIGSTFKGLVTGVVAGYFATRWQSVPKGVALGLGLGLALSWLVAAMPSESGAHYYLEIMLPGAVLGGIVGFATQRYGRPGRKAAQDAA